MNCSSRRHTPFPPEPSRHSLLAAHAAPQGTFYPSPPNVKNKWAHAAPSSTNSHALRNGKTIIPALSWKMPHNTMHHQTCIIATLLLSIAVTGCSRPFQSTRQSLANIDATHEFENKREFLAQHQPILMIGNLAPGVNGIGLFLSTLFIRAARE